MNLHGDVFFVDQIFNFEAQCSLFDLHVYVYVYIKCIYILYLFNNFGFI